MQKAEGRRQKAESRMQVSFLPSASPASASCLPSVFYKDIFHIYSLGNHRGWACGRTHSCHCLLG